MTRTLIGVLTAIALFIMLPPSAQERGLVLAAAGGSDSGSKKPAHAGSTRAASDEIARLLEIHTADYLKGNSDAWAAMYAEDAVFSSTGDRFDGRQAIRDHFAQIFKDSPTRTISLLSRSIRVYNQGPGATAVVNLENANTRTGSSGRKIAFRSQEVLVFVRIHGHWLIVNHQAWHFINPRKKAK